MRQPGHVQFSHRRQRKRWKLRSTRLNNSVSNQIRGTVIQTERHWIKISFFYFFFFFSLLRFSLSLSGFDFNIRQLSQLWIYSLPCRKAVDTLNGNLHFNAIRHGHGVYLYNMCCVRRKFSFNHIVRGNSENSFMYLIVCVCHAEHCACFQNRRKVK